MPPAPTPKPRKKPYTDLASVLILLTTFAGAVTLSTQFTVSEDCNHSRARVLLAYASQFFLVCPIGLFTIFMCLHGYNDDDVLDAGRHFFVRFQFSVVGIMLCAGFLLLNISILYTGARWLGTSGAALTGVLILTTTLWSVEAHMSDTKKPEVAGGLEEYAPESVLLDDPHDTVKGFLGLGVKGHDLPWKKKFMRRWIFLVLVLELVGIIVLLAMGIYQVATVARPDACQLL